MDITEVGRTAKMPWEEDGRQWHTHDRVGRTGEPCRWDGRILERLVDRIQELGDFAETDWSERSVVEICAERKSDGWFFHAITGETWLLKLKFRVYRGTFKRDELQQRIQLKTLNELADQAGRSVAVLLDLHDVLEGRVRGPVIGQQQVGIAQGVVTESLGDVSGQADVGGSQAVLAVDVAVVDPADGN